MVSAPLAPQGSYNEHEWISAQNIKPVDAMHSVPASALASCATLHSMNSVRSATPSIVFCSRFATER